MIYWKNAMEMITKNLPFQQEQIDFRNERISIKEVLIFNENGIRVPKELVEYEDDKLDYSDIPAITEEDIESGKLERVYTTEIAVKEEVAQWLTKSNIKLDDLVVQLVNNW